MRFYYIRRGQALFLILYFMSTLGEAKGFQADGINMTYIM
jgi:hypothetical protein